MAARGLACHYRLVIRTVDTVIVGAGQAGLLMSHLLGEAGRERVVLERRATLGGGWQDRWDEFCLVSPNWTVGLPGLPYDGSDPDGFMARDELIAHWRRYAAVTDAPVELETDVTRLVADADGASRFLLSTSGVPIRARSVVVAGGPFGTPHVPAIAHGLAPSILSLHAHEYRRAQMLPPGGFLLVGSGQTGVQLAEELAAAGRQVTLSVGRCGSAPRSYRGHDIFWWFRQLATTGAANGVRLPTVDGLPSPAARFACNPQLSGHDGGHSVDLRRMAASGIRIVGRLEALEGTAARFRPDLAATLRFAETWFDERLRPLCDAFAERTGGTFPPAELERFAFDVPEVPQLDLAAEGISTVLWTSGYRPAFEWVELPVLDEYGLPRQRGGITEVPGLTFIGTPWLVDMGSANLVGLGRDAEALVAGIVAEG